MLFTLTQSPAVNAKLCAEWVFLHGASVDSFNKCQYEKYIITCYHNKLELYCYGNVRNFNVTRTLAHGCETHGRTDSRNAFK